MATPMLKAMLFNFVICSMICTCTTLAWSGATTTTTINRHNTIKRSGRSSLKISTDDCETANEPDEPSVPRRSLSELISPNPKCVPKQMSPTSLAYIGDGVFELFARSRYVWPSRRTTDLQKLVVAKVRGE